MHEVQYAVTLKSIGEGVIATDAQGRVTMLNHVAETLTGWTNEEALGKPLDAFLRLRTRRAWSRSRTRCRLSCAREIVELGNHTVLTDRSGQVRPIADAASPIRNEGGKTLGVVLVFRDQSAERGGENGAANSEARSAPPSPRCRISCSASITRVNFWTARRPTHNCCWRLRVFWGETSTKCCRRRSRFRQSAVIARHWAAASPNATSTPWRCRQGACRDEQRVAPISSTESHRARRATLATSGAMKRFANLRLRLLEFAATHPLPALLTQTLHELGELVNSPIGFFHFVEADQRTLSLQAWLTRTSRWRSSVRRRERECTTRSIAWGVGRCDAPAKTDHPQQLCDVGRSPRNAGGPRVRCASGLSRSCVATGSSASSVSATNPPITPWPTNPSSAFWRILPGNSPNASDSRKAEAAPGAVGAGAEAGDDRAACRRDCP